MKTPMLLLSVGLLLGLGYGLGLLITNLGLWILRRRQPELASVLRTFVVGPVRLLILVFFLFLAGRLMQPSLTVSRLLTALEQVLLIIAIAWMILRVVEFIEEIARNQALRRGKTVMLPMLLVVRKTANLQIENLTRRDRFWYHPTIGLRYETTADQIRYVLVELHRLLYAHPKVDSASARVRFVGFGSFSLDIEVFSYVTVTTFAEYLEVAEDLNLRIMDIVAAAGSSFAFPSQTTYFEKGSGHNADRARAAEVQVQAWRERGELFLPRFPPEKITQIDNTLPYSADGSTTGTGPGR